MERNQQVQSDYWFSRQNRIGSAEPPTDPTRIKAPELSRTRPERVSGDSLRFVLVLLLQDVGQPADTQRLGSEPGSASGPVAVPRHRTHWSLDSGSVSMTILAERSTSSCRTASAAACRAISSATRAASSRCSLMTGEPVRTGTRAGTGARSWGGSDHIRKPLKIQHPDLTLAVGSDEPVPARVRF